MSGNSSMISFNGMLNTMVQRIGSSQLTLKRLLVGGMLATIVACGGTEQAPETPEPTNGLKVFVPEGVSRSKLPTNGNLIAQISVDGGPWQNMFIVNNQARVTLTDIPVGNHNFEVRFQFDSDEYSEIFMLASAMQSANIGGSSAGVSFDANSYDSSFDNDNDGRTNLEELDPDAELLNPVVPNLSEGEMVSITSPIPSEIATATLPSDGTLRAMLSINGGEERAMQIAGNSVSLDVPDLTLEQHDFKITFYVDSPSLGNHIPVAEIDQNENISNASDTPDFESATPNTAIDSDNDGEPNINEVIAGTPPFPTPIPTTPTPTVTPVVTETPTPTVTPVVTVTPTPTATPVVTVTPTPTPTPTSQVSVTIVENFGNALLVSDVLSVNVEFTPAIDNEGVHAYQWLKDGVYIDGATNSTYTVRTDAPGSDISVEVTPTNNNGTPIAEVTESNSVTVNNIPEATVSIIDANGGTPEIDDWLVGSYQYRDDDGDIEEGTTYRWLREISTNNYETIGEPNEDRYQITPEDNGRRIRFEVTPRASTGMQEGEAALSSPLTVTNNAAPTASNVRIVDELENEIDTSIVGITLYGTFDYSDMENDEFDSENTQYRWLNGEDIILNEDGSPYQGITYTPTIEDSGDTIYFRVTPYAVSGNTIGSDYPSEDGIFIANSAPSIDENDIEIIDLDGPPLLVENTVSVTYEFSDRDGDAEGATTFQWMRNGAAIPNDPANNIFTNQQSYVLSAEDADQAISVRITPIAASGVETGIEVESSEVIVGNAAPEITSASINPADTNNVYVVGETLSITYNFEDTDNDQEGDSLFTWYRGQTEVLQGAGSEFRTYLIEPDDSGASIYVEIVPVAQQGTQQGTGVETAAVNINALPEVSNASISGATNGTATIGTTLTAAYSLSDAEEPSQTSATLEWWRIAPNGNCTVQEGDNPISTASNYTVSIEDKNCALELRITPLAASGSSPGITEITSRITYQNSLPFIENLSIGGYTGEIVIHQTTLDPIYTFSDNDIGDEEDTSETGTQYRWYRIEGDTRTLIGSSRNYEVQEADSGNTIELQVTPTSLDGASGETQTTSVVVPVNTAPTVAAESIDITDNNNGEIIEGVTLRATYDFFDTENDEEGASTYRWYLNGDPILGANTDTLEVLSNYIGADITFSVIPVALTGIQTGEISILDSEAAVTVLNRYTVNTSANGVSFGTINPTSQIVTEGNSVEFQITPADDYSVIASDIDSNCGGAWNPETNIFTIQNIQSNTCLVDVDFKELHLVTAGLALDSPEGGSVSVDESDVRNQSTTFITISVDPGYEISDVTSDCGISFIDSSTTSYTTNMLVDDCDIEVSFQLDAEQMTPTLTLEYLPMKTLSFSWEDTPAETEYRLIEAEYNSEVFTEVARLNQDQIAFDHEVLISVRYGARYVLQACVDDVCFDSTAVETDVAGMESAIGYLKPFNTRATLRFGQSIAISADGSILAVGTASENSTSSDGTTSGPNTGGVYTYVKQENSWVLQELIKPPAIVTENEGFGTYVSISNDGSTLAISALREDSAFDSDSVLADGQLFQSGTVFIYERTNDSWALSASLKASNAGALDRFGSSIALSGNGNALIVGATGEDSSSNTTPDDNSIESSGAVYYFSKLNETWTQQWLIKAINPQQVAYFGNSLDINYDGSNFVIGAYREDSNARGINGDPFNTLATDSGAVYIYEVSSNSISDPTYVKASNTTASDYFGQSVSISSDGNTIAVGAPRNDTVVYPIPDSPVSMTDAGSVYIFTRSNVEEQWAQSSYIIRYYYGNNYTDLFGSDLSLSGDGNMLLISAPGEDSALANNPTNNSAQESGAAFLYLRSDESWTQKRYIKSTNPEEQDNFGRGKLSRDGDTIVIGAWLEDSSATGNQGDQSNNDANSSGAVYTY